jgi:hypothetical protein
MTVSYGGTLPDSIDHSRSIITPPGWVTPNEARPKAGLPAISQYFKQALVAK